jgi:hypothetical protein
MSNMKKLLKKLLPILMVTIATFSVIAMNVKTSKKTSIKDDYVPNKETAIKIAEAIWLPIYGNGIYNCKPFVAELRNDSIWVVQGTLKTGKGGVPYIEIQKADCKVLKVTHGK